METVSNVHKKQRGVVTSSGDQKVVYDYNVLVFKLEEQQKLIKELKSCLRTSEDKRKVLETRGKSLLMENQKLKSSFDIERAKVLALQKKLQVQDKVVKTKDVYPKTKKKESSAKLKSSSKSLMLKESSTQTLLSKEYHSSSGKGLRIEGKMPDVNPDVGKIERDFQQLKDILNKREQTWTKIAERDRELRERIAMVTSELATVRQVAALRSEDLHKKCIALKSTKDELGKAKKELLLLKQFTSKLKSNSRGQNPPKKKEIRPENPPPAIEIPKVALFHK